MKKNILILFLFLYTISFSQDTVFKKTNQIYFKAFAGWKMDGKRLSMKNFKNEIYKVPASIPIYTKGAKNRTIAFASYIPGLVFLLLSRQVTDISSPRFGKNNTGFAIAGLISFGSTFYFLFRSNKQLKEAARIYNDNQPLVY